MAAYTFRAKGTADQKNGACTAGAPAGVVAGDLLLLYGCTRNNSFTLATPSGWTKLSPNINDTYNYMFGRIATGSGDAPPTLTWSGTAQSYAECAAFFGDVYTDLATIVHASVDETGAGAGAGGNGIQYNALTITLANTLVIARGMHNKSATSDGCVVDALGGFTQIDQLNPNGNVFSTYWGYQQQVAATNLSSVVQTRSGAPSEALQQSSLFLSLKTLSTTTAAAKGFISNQQCINNG